MIGLALVGVRAEAAPVLRSADAQVALTLPTSCAVELTLSVDGASEIEHRIEVGSGVRIELLEIRGAEQLGEPREIGRTRALNVRPASDTYTLRYRVELPAARAYRCPLWLPTAPADGRSRDVRLRVRLPAGATPSGTLPTFTWVGGEGTAALGHLPAFVHVPYGTPDAPAPLNAARVMDIAAIATLVGATLFWARRRPRPGTGTATSSFAAVLAIGADTAARSDVTVPVPGFGWSFYGFFVAAAAWLILYFLWAWRAARHDSELGRDGR